MVSEQINKEAALLKEKAKNTMVAKFDTYCATGFYLQAADLMESIYNNFYEDTSKDGPLMMAVFEGIMEGLIVAEQMAKDGSVHRASPVEEIS